MRMNSCALAALYIKGSTGLRNAPGCQNPNDQRPEIMTCPAWCRKRVAQEAGQASASSGSSMTSFSDTTKAAAFAPSMTR